MIPSMQDPLLLRLGTCRLPRRRLFCMPYAGGGAAPYRQWHRSLPDDVEVFVAQLPGHEGRFREPLLTSIHAMVDAVRPAVEAASDLPFALFGHSMGALIAFELASALEHRGVRSPERLFVSARRPPDVPEPDAPVHGLPEAQFLDALQRRYGAIPEAIRQERELLDLLLPVVRADIEAVETYVPSAGARVRCPMDVYGGTEDRHPHPAQLQGWERVSDQSVRVRVFAGDHFFINQQRDAITADLAARWAATGACVEHT